MGPDKVAYIFEKSAQYIDNLEAQNTDLRAKLSRLEKIHSSGDSLIKVASKAELEEDAVLEAFETMTPNQKRILEKIASDSRDNDFSLGELSEETEYQPSADDALLQFMEN